MADPVTFTPDKGAYVRANAWLAGASALSITVMLWWLENPYIWASIPTAMAAVGLRSWYLASEELVATWEMTDTTLTGPGSRKVTLNQIQAVNTIGSFVQVVTKGGDKHLIKYQADPAATKAAIERAMA